MRCGIFAAPRAAGLIRRSAKGARETIAETAGRECTGNTGGGRRVEGCCGAGTPGHGSPHGMLLAGNTFVRRAPGADRLGLRRAGRRGGRRIRKRSDPETPPGSGEPFGSGRRRRSRVENRSLLVGQQPRGMPRETAEQYVGTADPEFSGRKAHRRAAVTAPTGQVEQDRPVLFDQAPQHDLRRFGQLYTMDSFVHQQDPIPHQKNPSSVGK